jgi:hypothetical protein
VIGATAERVPAANEELAVTAESTDKHRVLFWRSPNVADAAFARVLERSGLTAEDIVALMTEGATPDAAIAIAERLMKEPLTLRAFAPRAMLARILVGIAAEGRAVGPAEIRECIARHASLVMLRPDGVLASAISGEAIQSVGRVSLEGDKLLAGGLEVGRFYTNEGGCLREEGGDRSKPIVYELALEHDAANAVLDGVEDAFLGTARFVALLVTEPCRCVEDLARLPSAIGALLQNSNELLDLFLAMPGQDQARLAGEILAALLPLPGSPPAVQILKNASRAGGEARLIAGGVREAVGALQQELALAPALAGAVVVTGAPAIIAPGASALLSEMADLTEVARAGMKHAGRRLSAEGLTRARAELPKLVEETKRMLKMLETILRDESLPQNTRGAVRSALNAMKNHLKDHDLVGALRDALGVPVKKGDIVMDHLHEVDSALTALENAKGSLVGLLSKMKSKGLDISRLSKQIDAIERFVGRIRAFVGIK